MKIESIIQRKAGTTIDLDDTTYVFRPTAKDKRHICDVKSKRHVALLLAIPEGYQLADIEDEEKITEDPDTSKQSLTPGDDKKESEAPKKDPPAKTDTKAPKVEKVAAAKKSTRRNRGGKGKGKDK